MCDPISIGIGLGLLGGGIAADDARRKANHAIDDARAEQERMQREAEEMRKKQEEEEKQKVAEEAEKKRREDALRFGLTKTITTSPYGDLSTPATGKKALLGQ